MVDHKFPISSILAILLLLYKTVVVLRLFCTFPTLYIILLYYYRTYIYSYIHIYMCMWSLPKPLMLGVVLTSPHGFLAKAFSKSVTNHSTWRLAFVSSCPVFLKFKVACSVLMGVANHSEDSLALSGNSGLGFLGG
jgi:hypothetical protein